MAHVSPLDEEVERFKQFLKKVTILAIGVFLILFTIMALTNTLRLRDFLYSTIKISFLREIVEFLPLLYGISIIVCTLLNRKQRLWLAIFLSLLTVAGYIVAYEPQAFIPVGPGGVFGYITFTSIITVPFLLISYFIKKTKIWVYLVTALLLFSLMVGWRYATTINVSMSYNPYDTVERDEALTKMGYTFCGEYLIEPTPGIYKISWNKTFVGNESMACYFVVKLSRGDRPFYVIQNLTVKYERKSGSFGFYHSEGYVPNLDSAKHLASWLTLFYWHEPSTAPGATSMAPNHSLVFYRDDILVSYKPGIIEGEAVMEVKWTLEINLLWQM
jgi:hypothetical protein